MSFLIIDSIHNIKYQFADHNYGVTHNTWVLKKNGLGDLLLNAVKKRTSRASEIGQIIMVMLNFSTENNKVLFPVFTDLAWNLM